MEKEEGNTGGRRQILHIWIARHKPKLILERIPSDQQNALEISAPSKLLHDLQRLQRHVHTNQFI